MQKWGIEYVYAQPKLDGDRCRVIIKDGEPTLLSSEENIIKSVPHIEYELRTMCLPDMELDGELYIHGESHQHIHSIVSRTENLHPDFEAMQLHVFDIVSGAKQNLRLEEVKTIFSTYRADPGPIKRVRTKIISATESSVVEQMQAYYKEGYEGIILRHPTNLYVRRRSIGIMKFKPRKTDSYLIVGYEQEISIEGIPKQALGALWLQSDSGQRFKVGSGSFLTRENREELWTVRETLSGQIAEVAYQHLTDRRVPRFPVLMNVHSTTSATDSASGVEGR